MLAVATPAPFRGLYLAADDPGQNLEIEADRPARGHREGALIGRRAGL